MTDRDRVRKWRGRYLELLPANTRNARVEKENGLSNGMLHTDGAAEGNKVALCKQ
jgi:hypothetical protein